MGVATSWCQSEGSTRHFFGEMFCCSRLSEFRENWHFNMTAAEGGILGSVWYLIGVYRGETTAVCFLFLRFWTWNWFWFAYLIRDWRIWIWFWFLVFAGFLESTTFAMLCSRQCDVVLYQSQRWVIMDVSILSWGDIDVILSRGDACCRASRGEGVDCPLVYDGDVPSEIREFHTWRGILVVGVSMCSCGGQALF